MGCVDRKEALRAAQACAMSYSNDAVRLYTHEGYRLPQLIEGTVRDKLVYDVQCFVYQTDDYIEVCFRGSESIQDWVVDFMAVNHPCERRCGIHAGFYYAYKAVSQELVADLTDRLSQAQMPVRFTGHSLGGALAQIAAYDLHNFCRPQQVYTFGAPRWGNQCAMMRYELLLPGDRRHRFVNHQDIVPTIPPKLTGYRMPYDEWYLDRKGHVYRNPSKTYKWIDKWLGPSPHESVTDHFIRHYITVLQRGAN